MLSINAFGVGFMPPLQLKRGNQTCSTFIANDRKRFASFIQEKCINKLIEVKSWKLNN